MSDTIKSSEELKIETKFYDADTRLITLPNPNTGLTKNDVETAFANIIADNVIIGDKTGASITGLNTAYTLQKSTTYLDLS